MQSRIICFALATTVALAGCNSAKDASKSNFEAVINKAIAKKCVVVGPGIGLLSNSHTYPQSVQLTPTGMFMNATQAKQLDERNLAPYEALVKAGLLVGKDVQVPNQFNTNQLLPARTYDLTDEGKKWLQSPDGVVFCAAHFKVEEVTQFSQPGPSLGGVTASEVAFTYGPVDVAPWASNADVKAVYTSIDKQLAPHQQGHAELGLMNDGWSASAGDVTLQESFML